MNDQPSANIDANMPFIADQISGLRTVIIHSRSCTPLLVGGPGQTVLKILIDPVGKAGTVGTVGQACASRHVGVSDKLAGVFSHLFTQIASGGIFND